MKRIKLLPLLTALLCATTTWATDYNVGTDAELRAAIQNDGAKLILTAALTALGTTSCMGFGPIAF